MVWGMHSALDTAHRYMRRDHGLIRRSDALAISGLTDDMIDGLVRRGRWEAVSRGIYRVAGGPIPPQQPHLAATWRAGDGAVLTAGPALALLGVEGFDLSAPPVVLVPDDRRVGGVDFEVRYRPALPQRYRAMCGPVPIASPPRALVDLALRTRGAEFRVAFDATRRRRLVTPSRLREAAEQALPQHGARWVLRTLESGILEQESEPERILAGLFVGHDPPLEFQVWVLPGIRVDAAWPDAQLVIEYDGEAWHSLPTDREHDRARRAKLRRAGWSVLVVDKRMLADPLRLRRDILALRQRRLRELGTTR